MNDPFATLVSDANTFFAELEASNARDWFEPRKERYARTIRQPAELDLPRFCGHGYAA